MSVTYLVHLSALDRLEFQKFNYESQVTWWKNEQDDVWRAYVAGDRPKAVDSSELTLLTSLAGHSHQRVGDFHYIVETDVAQENEEEFNAWYETEHLPGLAKVPGTISAKRYLRMNGSPRYVACYELLSPAVMESEEWLAVRHTAWSSRVRPMFFNTVRVLFTRHQ
jgi:hypothetical protein